LPAFILADKKVVAFSYFCHARVYVLHQQKYYEMPKCKLEARWAASEPKLAITAALLTPLRENYHHLRLQPFTCCQKGRATESDSHRIRFCVHFLPFFICSFPLV